MHKSTHIVQYVIHIITILALLACIIICTLFFVISDYGIPFIIDIDHTHSSIGNNLFNAIFWLVLTIFIIGTILSVILFLYNLMHFRKLSRKVFWTNAVLDIYPLLLLFIVSGGNISNVAHLLACPITAFPFFS